MTRLPSDSEPDPQALVTSAATPALIGCGARNRKPSFGGTLQALCLLLVPLALLACGASLAQVQPHIDACDVLVIEHHRAGRYVVVRDTASAEGHRRIEYGGDWGELRDALRLAEAECGKVPVAAE